MAGGWWSRRRAARAETEVSDAPAVDVDVPGAVPQSAAGWAHLLAADDAGGPDDDTIPTAERPAPAAPDAFDRDGEPEPSSHPPLDFGPVAPRRSVESGAGAPQTPPTTSPHPRKDDHMASQLDQAVNDLLAIDGATGAAIVDYASGMALATGGNPGFSLDVAAAGNSNVIRAKLATMEDIGLNDSVDDILITLGNQYHLINVLDAQANQGLFLYLVLNKKTANLALARHRLNGVASRVTV